GLARTSVVLDLRLDSVMAIMGQRVSERASYALVELVPVRQRSAVVSGSGVIAHRERAATRTPPAGALLEPGIDHHVLVDRRGARNRCEEGPDEAESHDDGDRSAPR